MQSAGLIPAALGHLGRGWRWNCRQRGSYVHKAESNQPLHPSSAMGDTTAARPGQGSSETWTFVAPLVLRSNGDIKERMGFWNFACSQSSSELYNFQIAAQMPLACPVFTLNQHCYEHIRVPKLTPPRSRWGKQFADWFKLTTQPIPFPERGGRSMRM